LLIATPNITIDRTVRLPELRPGSVLRPSRAVATAGGKGVNVARVGAAFGRRATLVGFAPDIDAVVLDRLFTAEPLDFVGLPVRGEARIATIYLEDSGRVTVLNEPGPEISAGAWRRYADLIAEELGSGQYRTLVCSGSLPPGVPDDAYGQLVAIGHAAGVQVVVDAARAALAAALPFGPDVVTPNLAEAEGVLRVGPRGSGGPELRVGPRRRRGSGGPELSGHADEPVAESGPEVPLRACEAVRRLCGLGARSAAVTAGAAGTAFGSADEVVWVQTVPVEVVNPIGAGDSFVGGLVEALESGLAPAEAVVFAVATATASVETELAGGVDPARAREYAARLAGTASTEEDLRARV
jgi:fructose-1-phosphate kinase PfkB-like protein